MKFNGEKELAILLVSMVFCMIVLAAGELHTDHRVDRLVSENERIASEVYNLRSNKKIFARPLNEGDLVVDGSKNSVLYALPKEDFENYGAIDYDFDYVCRVVTAEGGRDAEVCMGVAQCLYNACEKHEWQYAPDKMLSIYQYTSPSDWVSDEAINACFSVFLYGNKYSPVVDATVFYAPKYCDSEWHEQQNFVCEINGVRFFKEN